MADFFKRINLVPFASITKISIPRSSEQGNQSGGLTRWNIDCALCYWFIIRPTSIQISQSLQRLLVIFPLGFKPLWAAQMALGGIYIKFASGATTANLSIASMAASRFSYKRRKQQTTYLEIYSRHRGYKTPFTTETSSGYGSDSCYLFMWCMSSSMKTD